MSARSLAKAGAALLLAVAFPLPLKAEPVLFTKIMASPEEGKPAFLEIYNQTSNPYDIADWRFSGGIRFDFPGFSTNQPGASFLKPFERIVLSAADPTQTRTAYALPESARIFGPWRGRLKPEGERVTLLDKNGVTACTLKYGSIPPWPGLPSPGHALVLLDPNADLADGRNWMVSSKAGPLPGAPRLPDYESPISSPELEGGSGVVLVDYPAVWHFNDTGQPPSPGWRQPAFDDGAWRQGPGLLGHDEKPLPKPGLRTRLNMGRQIAYYFRTRFSYSGESRPGQRLILDQILDDGAVYYLNGKEIARSRMPAGAVLPSTLTSSTVPTASEELAMFNLEPGLLVNGTNLLAVEVHQVSPSSSDLVFGMRLRLVAPPPTGLVINELFSDRQGGFVELLNNGGTNVSLAGCYLSDNPENLTKHRLDSGAVLAPGGLTALNLAECGLNTASPLALFLSAPDGKTVLSAVAGSFAEDGRAIGRRPDGSSHWFRLAQPTEARPNAASVTNAAPSRSRLDDRASAIVVNEIMYDPPYGRNGLEYIELFNRGTGTVDLSGWQLSAGIHFVFPPGTRSAPGTYTLVAADPARLTAAYGDLPILGRYEGRLRHRGELIRLLDDASNLVDEVDFRGGGDWPEAAHGDGSSLELAHPFLDNSLSSAWRASVESNKSEWVTFSCTNTYLEANPLGRPTDFRELQLYLVGQGHVALRNVGLFRDGVNYLDKPVRVSTDGTSASGWLAQGTHAHTFMTNGELHVVSDGRGNNKADRVELDCVRLRRGQTYILRFEARWISGCPRLVAHTWDRSIGSSFLLSLPERLGTPGKPNSISGREWFDAAASPPQVDHLRHSPVVPRAGQGVTISVQITSRAPLEEVRVFHRADSADGAAPWQSQRMGKATAANEELAAGALYLAELTTYSTNDTVVQFYVEAKARNGLSSVLPRAGAAQPALFVIDDRKIPRDGRLERFVVSAFDLGAMRDGNTAKYGYSYPRLSNHRYNMTFISDDETVYYGGRIRVSGSPFTRGRDLGKGKWELPPDRPFRGRTKFFFDNDSNFHNRLCRYLLYQVGHPASDAEWVRVIINSSGAYLKEETEPVTGEFLDRICPNGSEGELYRFDDEWWFADNWEKNNRDADWSYKGTDDPSQYRMEWQKRTREIEDDYSALIRLFRTYSAGVYSREEMERLVDPVAILQMAAVRGYIGDWDSFTMFRGKNGYFYRRPSDGKFQFFQWDSDLAFRAGNYPFYADRFAPWLERPENMRPFREELLKLARFTQSPRLAAWFKEEASASPARPVNAAFYQAFFRQRNRFLLQR